MSKLISDLINEFQTIDEIQDDFELFIMSIKIDESGEYDSSESILPVNRIEIDSENEECLFYFGTHDSDAITVATTADKIKTITPNFLLCSAEEKTVEDKTLRLDNPIIGFGENVEQKRFFLVFQTYELH